MRQKKITSINQILNKSVPIYKKASMLILLLCGLFIFIGVLTSIQPAYRLSSSTINDWTSQIKGSSFLHLMSMENKTFEQAYPENTESIDWSDVAFQMATSVKPNDARSLLGRELPGFEAYDSKIVIAGEGTDYTNLPIESSPPLEVVLADRPATIKESEEDLPEKELQEGQPTTGNRDVVFIYNSHNTESFLPHLPEGTTKNEAHHSEVNITKVSQRLGKALENNGIGSQVDNTSIMNILKQKGWEYWQSYDASKSVVTEAIANNKDINFLFDLHRDAREREDTTITINGKTYAKLMFVIGSDYESNDKNMQFATTIHKMINNKYPGLSRGVITQGGPGNNGVYNQDLSNNSILIEFGGVYNTMDELYRSADVFAEVFGEYYWDAEKVQGNP